MCLQISRNAVEKVAEEDIVCYKMLARTPNGVLLSPYKYTAYTLGVTNTSELERNDEPSSFTFAGASTVEKGLHTFANLDGWSKIINLKSLLVAYYGNVSMSIYEAVIPKGSKYYTGLFAGEASYASDALIVTDTVVHL